MLLFCSIAVRGQDTTTQANGPQYGWKHSLVAGLTLTQVAFTDWAQGGENDLAYTFNSDGKSVDDEAMSNWVNAYKLAFG